MLLTSFNLSSYFPFKQIGRKNEFIFVQFLQAISCLSLIAKYIVLYWYYKEKIAVDKVSRTERVKWRLISVEVYSAPFTPLPPVTLTVFRVDVVYTAYVTVPSSSPLPAGHAGVNSLLIWSVFFTLMTSVYSIAPTGSRHWIYIHLHISFHLSDYSYFKKGCNTQLSSRYWNRKELGWVQS